MTEKFSDRLRTWFKEKNCEPDTYDLMQEAAAMLEAREKRIKELEDVGEAALDVLWEWEDDGSPGEWTGWERHGTFKALAKSLGVWSKRKRAAFGRTSRKSHKP